MSEKRRCDGCGKEYWWPAAKWQHEGCEGLMGGVVADAGKGIPRVGEVSKESAAISGSENGQSGGSGVAPVSKCVWKTREEYNAHMREYMRVWRARKK